jgi:hypothetical protein
MISYRAERRQNGEGTAMILCFMFCGELLSLWKMSIFWMREYHLTPFSTDSQDK